VVFKSFWPILLRGIIADNIALLCWPSHEVLCCKIRLQATVSYLQNTVYYCQWHPGLLSYLMRYYLSARKLRLSDKLLLKVLRVALIMWTTAFSVSVPSIGNSLSHNCRLAELLSTSKRVLKTELYNITYKEREQASFHQRKELFFASFIALLFLCMHGSDVATVRSPISCPKFVTHEGSLDT